MAKIHYKAVKEIDSDLIWEDENDCLHMLCYDEFAQNPRWEMATTFTLFCNFGRDGDYSDPQVTANTFRSVVLKVLSQVEKEAPDDFDELPPAHLAELMRQAGGVVFPVYGISHSGLHVSLRDYRHIDPQGFDSGIVGLMWAEPDTLVEEFGDTGHNKEVLHKAYVRALQEISVLNSWLAGDVYLLKTWEYDAYNKLGDNEYSISDCYEVVGGYIGTEAAKIDYPPKIPDVEE